MSDSDDDVVFIPNPTGKAQLPHARCACETHIFVPPPAGQLRHYGQKNKEKCATCFCYVCDKPAKECTSWDVHCDATDKGPNAAYWKIRRNEVKRGGAPAPPKQQTIDPPSFGLSGPSSYQPDFIPAKRYKGIRPGYTFKYTSRGMGYYKDSASAPAARPAATPSLSAERKAMRDGLAAFAADNSARELYAVRHGAQIKFLRRAGISPLDSHAGDPRRVLPVARGGRRPLRGQRRLRQRARRAHLRGPQGRDPQGRARDALRRDAHEPRRHRLEAGVDGVRAQGLQARQAVQPVGYPGLYPVFRQGAEAARAADGDGAPGQGLAHEGPAGARHVSLDVLRVLRF
jgi:hypothetical protein